MMQASDITGGVYMKVPEPASLVQFMLVCMCDVHLATARLVALSLVMKVILFCKVFLL